MHHDHNSHLKVGIVRHELVFITKNITRALLLNQIIYWTEKLSDVSEFLAECILSPKSIEYGWIYKSAPDFLQEVMGGGINKSTIERHLLRLVKDEWIFSRSNQKMKYDKTRQYRLNFIKIKEALDEIGHNIPFFKKKLDKKMAQTFMPQFAASKPQIAASKPQIAASYTYTETTTETTTKKGHALKPHVSRLRRSFLALDLAKVLSEWNDMMSEDIKMTPLIEDQLTSMMTNHFESDIGKWIEFCAYIKQSDFLMRGNEMKWRPNLGWIMRSENIAKVKSGTYHDKNTKRIKKTSPKVDINRLHEIVASISDIPWKRWCEHMVQRKGVVCPIVLNDISKARFTGEVDERGMVYLEAFNYQAFNQIERLRHEISKSVAIDYPTMRGICVENAVFLMQEHRKGNG